MPLAFTTGTSSHPKNTLQKRKFDIKVLLLLHVLIPEVMLLSPLDTINPWLSACDLKQQGPSDLRGELRGSCTAAERLPGPKAPLPDVELPCPKECPPNESKTNASCLAYLDETRKNAICNFNVGNGIEWLKSFLGTIRLRHCCEFKIIETLSGSLLERVLKGKDACFEIIDSLVEVDNLAARVTCQFAEILSRYDCRQPYSAKFSCSDCLEAYRRWVCSTLVPYHNESVRVRPCRSVCQAVEQKCPYFLPENKAPTLPTQYAGEPTFLCMDPNIPETGEQQEKSLYPDLNTCCVKICGSLKDGLCVDKGCRSENLVSYEDALDEVVQCSAVEVVGPRTSGMECTATEPYNSPYRLGSGATRGLPEHVPLLLSACLVQKLRHFVTLLFLYCCVVPASLAETLADVVQVFTDSPLKNSFSNRFKRAPRLFFHYIKRPHLIFNYFKFNSYKWQYYFILISVNLLFKSLIKSPEPLMTLSCLINEYAIGEKTRRARRCNFRFKYYYCYKHYYTILSRIAQNSKVVSKWRKPRGYLVNPLNLVIPTGNREGKTLSSKKNKNSLTLKGKKSCGGISPKHLTERSRREGGAAEAPGAPGGRGPGGGRGPPARRPRPRRPPGAAPARDPDVAPNFAKSCCFTMLLSSDPQCEFLTFYTQKLNRLTQ